MAHHWPNENTKWPTLEDQLFHFGATWFSPSIEILYDWPIIVDCDSGSSNFTLQILTMSHDINYNLKCQSWSSINIRVFDKNFHPAPNWLSDLSNLPKLSPLNFCAIQYVIKFCFCMIVYIRTYVCVYRVYVCITQFVTSFMNICDNHITFSMACIYIIWTICIYLVRMYLKHTKSKLKPDLVRSTTRDSITHSPYCFFLNLELCSVHDIQ